MYTVACMYMANTVMYNVTITKSSRSNINIVEDTFIDESRMHDIDQYVYVIVYYICMHHKHSKHNNIAIVTLHSSIIGD